MESNATTVEERSPALAVIRITAGSQSTLAAQAGTDIFFSSASNGGSFGLGCMAGRGIVGTPAAGAANGDQL